MPQTIGIKELQNILSNRVVVDMDDTIHRLEPNENPFMYFMSELGKESAHNPKFEWLEKDIIANWSDITDYNAGVGWTASASGNITVPERSYFRKGDVIQIPHATFSIPVNLVVNAVSGTSGAGTITAQTVDGSSVTLTDTGTDKMKILSSSDEEGSPNRDAKSTVALPRYNYIQIFKTDVALTEIADATKLYGEQDRNEQRFEKGLEHTRKIEQAMFFGSRNKLATGIVQGNNAQYFTGGVYNLLNSFDSNVIATDGTGTLTEDNWNAWLLDALRYGSEQKVVFCSEVFASAMTSWAQNNLRITNMKQTSYGMKIVEWEHPVRGTVKIVVHNRIFDKVPYNGMAICLDLKNTKYRFLEGYDTKLITDIQNDDTTEFKDEFRTYAGLQISVPKTHRILKGVSGYA